MEQKEEVQMTGRRRRSSVKELIEKIKKGVAVENSSKDRLMRTGRRSLKRLK